MYTVVGAPTANGGQNGADGRDGPEGENSRANPRLQPRLARVLLVATTVLALLPSCSDTKEDLIPGDPVKRFKHSSREMARPKGLIGTTYRVAGAMPVRLCFLPNSWDKVELAEGEEFRIENLITNRADPDDSHYVLMVVDAGQLYLSVYELQKMIRTEAIVEVYSRSGRG